MVSAFSAKAIATTNKDYLPIDGRIPSFAVLSADPYVYEFDVTPEMAQDESRYIVLRIDYEKGEKPVFTAENLQAGICAC